MGKKSWRDIIIKDSNYVAHSKEHAMKNSIKEGSAASFSDGVSSLYITPYALALGANSLHIGFLSSFTGIFHPIGQLLGSKFLEKKSRKNITLFFTFLQVFIWLPIIGLIFLFSNGLFGSYIPLILIILFSAFVIFGGFKQPAFFSWMGDIVPPNIRGEYFAKRNKINGFVGLMAFVVAGLILDFFGKANLLFWGFGIIFFMAIISRYYSYEVFKRIFNPQFRLSKGYYFGFFSFLKKFDNFGKFSVYQAFFYFSLMTASPFFAVYMLQDLGFSYITFTLVSVSSTIFYLLVNPLVGKFSDRYGSVKLMYISGVLFPLVPLVWLFTENPITLFFVFGSISGIANATLLIATTNFTYDSVSPQRRGLCVAYSGILSGAGIFLGSILGGFLVSFVELDSMNPIIFVFLVSFVLRALSSIIFLPSIKEERKTQDIRGFSADFHHPFRMVHSDVVWFKNFFKK